jgi:hypothetical protein
MHTLEQLHKPRIGFDIVIDQGITNAIDNAGTGNAHSLVISSVQVIKRPVHIPEACINESEIEIEVHIGLF